MEVETEKAGVNTTLELSENAVEQLKTEIQYLSKEKSEVVDQFNAVRVTGKHRSLPAIIVTESKVFTCVLCSQTTRQKNSLAEELVSARRELERTNETCIRIAKEKEGMNKEKAQLVVELTASERENRAQSEVTKILYSTEVVE